MFSRYCRRRRTSRKRPPKMQRFNGRLLEVVSYENKGYFSSRGPGKYTFNLQDNLIHAISKLRYMLFRLSLKVRRILRRVSELHRLVESRL